MAGEPRVGPAGYAYYRCRGIAHQWEDIDSDGTDYPWPHIPPANRLTQLCLRCGDIVHKACDEFGNYLYAPIYRRPDDYHVAADDDPGKAGWRLMVLEARNAQRQPKGREQ